LDEENSAEIPRCFSMGRKWYNANKCKLKHVRDTMRSKTNIQFGRVLAALAVCMVIIVLSGGSVLAAASSSKNKASSNKTSSTSSSSSVNPESQATTTDGVEGYSAATTLQDGTIVQLTGAGSSTVEPVSQANSGKMYGVTVDPEDLPLTISNSGLTNETYVATTGTYDALVSTQGGIIQPGTFIAISSVDGVGMAAGTANTTVIGRAAQGFSGQGGIGAETLKNSVGSTVNVTLGIIPVAIQIEHNPTKASTKVNLPKMLQRLGQAVAERPISPIRTYLSIAITGISTIMALIILYAGVRSGLISIGRNPLSKGHIFRGLLAVVLTSLIVLIVGLFAVYLLLKL
jgi:hypothetical protein